VPQFARYYRSTNLLEVVFDRPLVPGVLTPGNWTGHRLNSGGIGLTQFVGVSGFTAAGDTITGTCSLTIAGSGQPRVTYAATPPDVVSTLGIPAAAFADFPLTTLP
jgi:hypothetical protein